MYNEVDNVEPFITAVHDALGNYPFEWELLIVNDGSRDGTREKLDEQARLRGPHVRPVHLWRNFRQTAAMQAGIDAAEAVVKRLEIDLADGDLHAPRAGRVQYRIVQPGEVIAGGGKVVSLVDIADVYMTFFLPEQAAGKVGLGSDVHIVLDAAPQYVLPARVSYVASVAQFTPKSVETQDERQKMVFRVKARLDPALLKKYAEHVKTGLPGMAYVRLDPAAAWPAKLEVQLP